MPDVIACPTCSKKYKLPDRPPALFTCKACNTTMDLSAFAGAAPAAAAAPPPPPAAPSPSSSRTGGRSSAARSRGGARAGARAGRRGRGGGDEDDGDEGEGRRGFAAQKKGNPAVLWGSIGGLVLIVCVVALLMGKKKAETPVPDKKKETVAAPTPPPTAPIVEADAGMEGDANKPAFVSMKNVQIHPVGHHPDATAEEQAKIDQLIDLAVFQNAGRDSRDAETALVAIGVKAAPRLINVFNTVKGAEGFANRLGLMKAGIADSVLRRIDGYIERTRGKAFTPIHAQSDSTHAERIVKSWYFWWDNQKYKTPQKPWDERVDGKAEDVNDSGGSDAPK